MWAPRAALDLLFTMDPLSGQRAVLSDFGDATQGPIGGTPFGVARELEGGPFKVLRTRI